MSEKYVDHNYRVFIIWGFYNMFRSKGTNFRKFIYPKLLRRNVTLNPVSLLSNFGYMYYLGPKRVLKTPIL